MLLTDWHVLATAGDSIDGREIQESWLIEAAETYDPDYYEAVIDAEHDLDWFGSYGHVYDVRLGKNKNGETILEGRLRPNMRCIEQYQRGQRLHFSIWIEEDFRNTGKAYLFRLALTDEPASVGTSRLNLFSINPPAQFSTNKRIVTEPKLFSMNMADDDITLFRKFMDWLKPQNQQGKPETKFNDKTPEQDEDAMTPEQLKQLTTAFTSAIETQGEKFTAAIAELKKTPETVTTPATPPAGDDDDDKQFSAAELSKTLKAIQDGQKNLEDQFAELKKTPGNNTQFTDFTGPSEDEDISSVC